MNSNITDAEIQRLESTDTQNDWDTVVDDLRKAREGELPADWEEKVESSGLKQRVTANFGVTTSFGDSMFGD